MKQKPVSARLPEQLHTKVIAKCKATGFSVATVITSALNTWVESTNNVPWFEMANKGVSPVPTPAGSKLKHTVTVCSKHETCKPIGVLKLVGEDASFDDIFMDEAGNLFNNREIPMNEDGELCQYGKPKWWKEKQL